MVGFYDAVQTDSVCLLSNVATSIQSLFIQHPHAVQ